jgi:hypothetical protein
VSGSRDSRSGLMCANFPYREAGGTPRLRAAVEVGCTSEAELLEARCGEARCVGFIAHHDDVIVELWRAWVSVLARRVKQPLEHIA